ncbi:MAG: hypothetical protein PHG85_01310 [Candidatus Altiarchaeota archaeon]|nr:hypothetical protein [Candidatus Altiarchaeota archaeon]
MDSKKAIITALMLALTMTTAHAARVGVVISFPDGTTSTACAEVSENANAYDVIRQSDLPIEWSYDALWGHGLCGINGIGCASDNCYCSSDYWGFYIYSIGWKYSPVGFDGGDTCWNGELDSYEGHYCARDGDLLGLAYGPYGTKPKRISFGDICTKDEQPGYGGEGLFNMTVNMTDPIHRNSLVELTVYDIKRNRTVKKATVIVYDNNAGTGRLYEGVTDANGTSEFTITRTGMYTLEIRALDYHTISRMINVADPTTTTMETTTSTQTTTTTTEPSTTEETRLPHFLYLPKTTSSIQTTTTLQEPTTTIQTATTTIEEPKVIGMAASQTPDNFGQGILLAAIAIGLTFAYLMLRR